jgi:hypothetical protein
MAGTVLLIRQVLHCQGCGLVLLLLVPLPLQGSLVVEGG